MQYRVSLGLRALAELSLAIVEFVAVWALFDRFGPVGAWSLADAAVLYGTVHIAFVAADLIARGFDQFSGLVRTGEFDRILLRPRSAALQILGSGLHLKRLGRLVQCITLVWWGLASGNAPLNTAPIIWLGLAILSSACLFVALIIVQATLAFWTIDSLEMMNCVTHGGAQALQYPLDIYEPWFRTLFLYIVPGGLVCFWPVSAALGQPAAPSGLIALGLLAGPGAIVGALLFWRVGVRSYLSTGS